MTRAFACFAALLATAGPAIAEEDRRGFLSLTVENDRFGGTDQGYTNGLRLSWLTRPTDRPFWQALGLQRLPLFDRTSLLRYETSIGQSMFTPRDIATREPDPLDRPYAGFSYLTFGIVGLSPQQPAGGRRLDELELTIGIIGPASLAGDTQRIWHKSFGFQRPNGWEQQLANEPAINLSYRRSQRLPPANFAGLSADFTPHIGFAIGNVYDYASVGGMIRIGAGLADFGAQRIEPAVPGSAYFARAARPHLYGFAAVDARAVLRNIFLDGNSFQSGPSVEKHPLVADVEIGAVLVWQSMRLSYTHIIRTREFVGQPEPASFGSINLSVAY